MIGYLFKKLSPLKRPFDRLIVRFREAGILNNIRLGFGQGIKEKIESGSQRTNQVVLKISHYEVPFLFLIAMLSFDFIIFLLELLMARFLKHCRKCRSKI